MSRSDRRHHLSPLILIAPLAVVTAVLLWDGGPPASALPGPTSLDRERAQFTRCGGARRQNCVVDGDTFRYRGEKIRIADINTPEVREPGCAREAALGKRAARRLTELLNAGAFSLEPVDRDRDRYGRLLREVTRGGESLGATLEAEGLAEPWRGRRGDWCG